MEDFLLLDVFSWICWANWPLNNPENGMYQLTRSHPVSCQVFRSQEVGNTWQDKFLGFFLLFLHFAHEFPIRITRDIFPQWITQCWKE